MKRNLAFFLTASLVAAATIRGCSPAMAQENLAAVECHAGRRVVTEAAHTARASQAKSEAASVGGQRAVNFQITDKLLDAIAAIESSGKSQAIGDGGKARGMFQMWKPAWEDARKINPAIGDYETGSLDPKRSRQAATTYLNLLANRLEKATGQKPTSGQLYAAYNLGFGGFKKRGFDLAKTPKTTQKAIKRLEALL